MSLNVKSHSLKYAKKALCPKDKHCKFVWGAKNTLKGNVKLLGFFFCFVCFVFN